MSVSLSDIVYAIENSGLGKNEVQIVLDAWIYASAPTSWSPNAEPNDGAVILLSRTQRDQVEWLVEYGPDPAVMLKEIQAIRSQP